MDSVSPQFHQSDFSHLDLFMVVYKINAPGVASFLNKFLLQF